MTFVVFAVCREPTKYRHPSAGRKKTRQGQSLFTPSAKQRNAPERAHFAKAKNANCSYATVRSPAHDRHEPRRHIDRRSVPQCHHGSIRPTELRLALPRLWPRERADDRDVPLQAVAEDGGNVLNHLPEDSVWKAVGFFEGTTLKPNGIETPLGSWIRQDGAEEAVKLINYSFREGIRTGKAVAIENSKEAKKAALLDKIMPRIKSVGHVCPMLEFRQECIVCDVVSEYDAIEKDGKS